MELVAETVVAQEESCLSAEVQDEVVIMSVRRGRYVTLNASGKDIWSRIAKPRRIDEVCAELANLYDAPIETIKLETLEFVDRLVAQGLAVIHG